MLDLAWGLRERGWAPVIACNSSVVLAEAARLGVKGIATEESHRPSPAPTRLELGRWSTLMERERPDLVHVNSVTPLPPVLFVAMRHAIPVVVHQHILDEEFARLYSLIHQASAIVAISQVAKDALAADGFPSDRLYRIPNGVRVVARHTESPLRQLLNAQIGDIVGISVGSLISRKGHDQTIAALQRVPKTSARLHIAIVGSGPEEDTLRMMAHQAGVDDRLHWLGQRDDVQSLVAGADFFLTAAKEEVQPLSVIEAMLLRKPIVASAIPAHAEMVSQNQDGLLADATDPDRFAAAILHAATDVEWRRRTSAHLAMTAADRYGFDQFMMGFTDLYSFLIAQPEHEFAIPRALRWMPGYRRWLGSMLRARLRLH